MPRVSELHVLTKHDVFKRPDAICMYCGEDLIHGEDIVGMPLCPGSPRWQNRQWHEECFKTRFNGELIPREARFSPITTLIKTGR